MSNHANLAVHHGWTGVAIDGNERNIEIGKYFYEHSRDTRIWPPTLLHAWVDSQNINDLVKTHYSEPEIDLLSIDIDGADYWVLKELDVVRPRVIVAEFIDFWGPSAAVTVPNDSGFVGRHDEHGLYYGGASLCALVKLCREKGYRLVGCQRYGFNAFFVRNDVGADDFPEVTPESCLTHPKVSSGISERLQKAQKLEWVEV